MSKKENTWELTKFLITGLVCALADFLTTSAFLQIFKFLPGPALSATALLAGFAGRSKPVRRPCAADAAGPAWP